MMSNANSKDSLSQFIMATLPSSVNFEERKGLSASFDSKGYFISFGNFSDQGEPLDIQLLVDLEEMSGSAIGGTSEYETYKEGHSELYNAWSDNAPLRPISMKDWLQEWIIRITETSCRRSAAEENAKTTRELFRKNGKSSVLKLVK